MNPSAHPLLGFLLEDAGGGLLNNPLLMLPICFAIFYFIMIRPQQRERKAQQAMRSELKKGDEVITQFGVVAKIHQVKDNVVVLDLDGKATMQVVKDAITRRVGDLPAKDAAGSKNGKEAKLARDTKSESTANS